MNIVLSLEQGPPYAAKPLTEALIRFSIYSSVFWLALIGNIVQGFGSEGFDSTIIQRSVISLSLICLAAYLVRRHYPRLKQSREETTNVITNQRFFKAPTADGLVKANWTGPKDSSIWFAETLFVEKGGHVTNPMLIFVKQDPNYRNSEHTTTRHLIKQNQLTNHSRRCPIV